MTQSRDQAAKALEVRDQRIASLEGELAQVPEAAERSRAEAQRLAEAAREAAKLRSTAAQENQRPAAPEAALSGTANGPHRTVLASGIFVAPGSNQLAARAAVPLREAADLIQQSSGPVRIVGHMDATGDPKANRQLSLRRAEAVRDYLVFTYRFDPARFKVEGRGSDEPVAANNTAAGRRANRRVEILFSG
jgi:outer membrane protein OmpA-like peptidoglycan-associated protein